MQIFSKLIIALLVVFLEGIGVILGGISFLSIYSAYYIDQVELEEFLIFVVPLSIIIDIVSGLPVGSNIFAIFSMNLVYSLLSIPLPDGDKIVGGILHIISFSMFRLVVISVRSFSLGEGIWSGLTVSSVLSSLLIGLISWLLLTIIRSLLGYVSQRSESSILKI